MRGPNKKLIPLGQLVVKALTDQNKTKSELAAEIGITPQYLSYILNGTRPGNIFRQSLQPSNLTRRQSRK